MKWDKIIRIFSIAGFLIAGILYVKTLYYLQTGEKADALVTDVFYVKLKSSRNFAGSEGYYPILEFKDKEGKHIKIAKNNFLVTPSLWEKGDIIPIIYLKNDPDSYMNDSFNGLYLASIIAVGVSLLLLLVSFLFPGFLKLPKSSQKLVMYSLIALISITILYFLLNNKSTENVGFSYYSAPDESELLMVGYLLIGFVCVVCVALVVGFFYLIYKLIRKGLR